ncbi:plasmid replication protein RepC [Mangrovicoccus algicola]|uniref:Winged helix-turn-helix transcriptional regulator n=1 Tax=Mangrovicoccus algicola TaxID=2771008 RepID=A0A8J6YV69_9RHOB|nr:plasmid replication protein RepC [Mangrovicoccus algicola]MBE3638357.1 winged helix-turn-helix transcriptional regulator [Mangrovicoccus algicola]
MRHPSRSGWRRQDEALLRAEALSREGTALAVAKHEALIAAKRAARHLGLRPGPLMLLDTLCAFSPPQDWEEGRQPLVWPSNALLMDRTGLSLSALRRHLRKLCDCGLIGFRDSPNGKRWGRRDADGRIVDACGIDLGPLAARASELAALNRAHDAERQEQRQLTARARALHRTIQARIALLASPDERQAWTDRLVALAATPRGLPSIRTHAETLAAALAELDAQLAPKGPENDTHIENTIKDQDSVTTAMPSDEPKRNSPAPADMLEAACPAFFRLLQANAERSGPDNMISALAHVAGMSGITDRLWRQTVQKLGPGRAIQAIALITEKTASREIRDPCAYLAGMLRKDRTGNLHLDRSIRSRAATPKNRDQVSLGEFIFPPGHFAPAMQGSAQ